MAASGGEYEEFVYEKLRRLFADSVVRLRDKIFGRQSGLLREIDVSIRTQVGPEDVLYVVQCKDRAKRPADMVILGEFSSVIQDVGAAKGFLVCTSGFARSNHRYARTLGIELITVEDVKSKRWNVDIHVPLVYVKKHINYQIAASIVANDALVEMNYDRELAIHFDASTLVTVDQGKTPMSIQAELDGWIAASDGAAAEGVAIDLSRPDLHIDVAGVWAECPELTANLTVGRRAYLKYLTPDEYSQIRDHVRDEVVPLHLAIRGVFPILDDTFVEVPGGETPVFAGLWAQVEEWTDLERAQGKGPSGS